MNASMICGEISAKASSICSKNEQANFSSLHFAELAAKLFHNFCGISDLPDSDK